jgi:hypothetical protein
MKRILLIFALLAASLSAMAQGFSADEGKLSWQFVFPAELTEGAVTMDDIYKAVIYSDDYRDIVKVSDDILVAELKPVMLNVEDYGFKRMRTPTYLLHYMTGPVTIRVETREGRYRVTATNIRLTNRTSNFVAIGAVEDIEDYALTDGKPNEQLAEYIAPMLGDYFIKTFLFKPQEEEEW